MTEIIELLGVTLDMVLVYWLWNMSKKICDLEEEIKRLKLRRMF